MDTDPDSADYAIAVRTAAEYVGWIEAGDKALARGESLPDGDASTWLPLPDERIRMMARLLVDFAIRRSRDIARAIEPESVGRDAVMLACGYGGEYGCDPGLRAETAPDGEMLLYATPLPRQP